jgi:hypothetical protein
MKMLHKRTAGEWAATPIQEWMQEHDEANPDSGFYVLPFTWSVAGTVDWPAFVAAFEAVCERYPVLRGSMRRDGDSWTQMVRAQDEVPLAYHDARRDAGPDSARSKLLEDSYHAYCRRPFRLVDEPPIRALVIQLDDEFLVFGAFHSIACDIESMAIFIAEFWELYEASRDGRAARLPDTTVDFAEFAARTQVAARAQEAAHLDFWRARLEGVDVHTPVPVDFPHAAGHAVGPAEYIKIGGPPTALAAHAVAKAARCSEHAVLLAAFTVALAARTGRSSFLVSCPVSLRRSAELFGSFGPLTDVAWLRLDLGGPTVLETVGSTFRGILQALSKPCPIGAVARLVTAGPGRRSPNIQCQFFPPERIANPSWVSSSVQVKQTLPVYLLTGPLQTPYWLDLVIAGERNQPDTDFSLVYRTDLFRHETAQALADAVEAAILAAAEACG